MAVPGLFLLTSLLVLTFAVDCYGNEDNCILSFVVPRDKVKSSCDMEERVTRRLNSVETKVALYKQHVQELTQQLDKERQLHQQQLDDLTQRLALREKTSDPLLVRRLQGLEEELSKVRALAMSSRKPVHASGPGEKPHGRGAGLNLLLGGRSREEEEKALAILVKSVVHSEVEKLFSNYTHYVTRYIREQALAFNQVINMVPRHFPNHVRNEIERESSTPAQPQAADKDAALLNQLEGIRHRLSNSSMHPSHNGSDNVSTTHTPPQVTDPPQPSTSSPSDHDFSMDINDTSSGDANDSVNDGGAVFTVTPEVNDTALPDARSAHSLPMPASHNEEALAAKSRMSYNADLNKLPEPSAGGGEGPEVDSGEVSNVSGWKEAMIHDQGAPQWLTSKLEEMVRKQVDEAMTLFNKRTAQMDDKMQLTTYNLAQLENRLGADIKQLNQEVRGVNLEMSSVTQGLQAVQGRLQDFASLEDNVLELKKNMSQEGGSRLLATLLDEQGKKVRKVERLTAIYKQSLEHYRNETKLEYRGLRDRLDKEAGLLRAHHNDLWHNVTQHAAQLTNDLNHTTTNTINSLTNRLKLLEDSDLLQGIDLSTIERQMKTRASRAERDLKKLSEDVSDLKQKARGLQKNINSALTKQGQLEQGLNTTTTNMRTLQIEVQLEVLDDWVPFEFPYMKTRTDCFGDQYIRKSGFKVGRLVGVVLCTNTRYKIFLGQSLEETFKNIGDDSGMGEDHCQFVHARSMSQVRVSPFRTSTETEPGFVRTHWGQEPRPELLNIIRPSPAWYECGVSIP